MRRIGVPFIAIRGLGVVANLIWKSKNILIYGRTGMGQCIPSLGFDWRFPYTDGHQTWSVHHQTGR
jgi:hypothetical protein